MNKITYYQTPAGRKPVQEYIDACERDVRERIFASIRKLKEYGSQPPPFTKKLVGTPQLRELRISHGRGISRIIYFTETPTHFVLLHGFTKKTQKVPPREIETAKQRLKHFLETYHGPY